MEGTSTEQKETLASQCERRLEAWIETVKQSVAEQDMSIDFEGLGEVKTILLRDGTVAQVCGIAIPSERKMLVLQSDGTTQMIGENNWRSLDTHPYSEQAKYLFSYPRLKQFLNIVVGKIGPNETIRHWKLMYNWFRLENKREPAVLPKANNMSTVPSTSSKIPIPYSRPVTPQRGAERSKDNQRPIRPVEEQIDTTVKTEEIIPIVDHRKEGNSNALIQSTTDKSLDSTLTIKCPVCRTVLQVVTDNFELIMMVKAANYTCIVFGRNCITRLGIHTVGLHVDHLVLAASERRDVDMLSYLLRSPALLTIEEASWVKKLLFRFQALKVEEEIHTYQQTNRRGDKNQTEYIGGRVEGKRRTSIDSFQQDYQFEKISNDDPNDIGWERRQRVKAKEGGSTSIAQQVSDILGDLHTRSYYGKMSQVKRNEYKHLPRADKNNSEVILYYGGSYDRLLHWTYFVLELYELYAIASEDHVMIARKYLAGKAQEYWQQLMWQDYGATVTTFPQMVQLLKQKFCGELSTENTMMLWKQLRFSNNVHEFLSHVEKLRARAPMTPEAISGFIMNVLPATIKERLTMLLFERKQEYLTMSEFEELLPAYANLCGIKQTSRVPFSKEKVESRTGPLHLLNEVTVRNKQGTTNIFTCFVCDLPGHRASECRKKKAKGCWRCGESCKSLQQCAQWHRRQEGNTMVSGRTQIGTGANTIPIKATTGNHIQRNNELVKEKPTQLRYVNLFALKLNELVYEVNVNGRNVNALCDTGASNIFITDKLCNELGLVKQNYTLTQPIQLADTSQMQLLGSVWVSIAIGAGHIRWKAIVIQQATHELYLGLDFLMNRQMAIDWNDGSLILKGVNKENVVWRCKTNVESMNLNQLYLRTTSAQVECEPQSDSDCDDSVVIDYAKQFKGNEVFQEDTYHVKMQVPEWEYSEDVQKVLASWPSQMIPLYHKYSAVFDPPKGLPDMTRCCMQIELYSDAEPVKARPRRLPQVELDEVQKQVETYLDNGWIVPSHSDWCCNILLVDKKTTMETTKVGAAKEVKQGAKRMCINYKPVNRVTVKDAHPLPRIDDLLIKAGGSDWFSKLDLQSGYHQIAIHPTSRKYTAFCLSEPVCGCTLFEWTVMPFGLTNAPAVFQRTMISELMGFEWCVVVYIDDILIYTKGTEQEHCEVVEQVLERLCIRGWKVRLSKVCLCLQQVDFCGFILSSTGLKMEVNKKEAIQSWEGPLMSRKMILSFLGTVSYYRSFLPHLSTIIEPLLALIRNNKRKIEWNSGAQQSFEQVKALLCSDIVLQAWNADLNTRVTTDASDVGIGAVLEQQHNEIWKPVAFYSRQLNTAERNYSATDKEWLAVVVAVARVWYIYLVNVEFTLLTDHAPLCQVLRNPLKVISTRRVHWVEELMSFKFKVQYLKGQHNTLADALSRTPVFLRAVGWDINSMLYKAAVDDPQYCRLLQEVRDGNCTSLVIDNGLLKRVETNCIYVPNALSIRAMLLYEHHANRMYGHCGRDRMYAALSRRWYWPGMAKDVKRYVHTCLRCQQVKSDSQRGVGGIPQSIIACSPWEIVTLDFVSGLPPDKHSKQTDILVMVDKFSKMTLLEPCRTNISAGATVRILMRRVVCVYGVPRKIISDRGPQFDSHLWKELLVALGSRAAIATPHHPQTDGQTERMNRTMLQILKSVLVDKRESWVLCLPYVQFAMNNLPNSTTGESPFWLNYGRHPIVPLELCLRPVNSTCDRQNELQRLHETIALVNEKVIRMSERVLKRLYPRRVVEFKVGDYVWVNQKATVAMEDVARKIRDTWVGPFRIVRRVNPNAYELTGLPRNVPAVQNVEFLKLCETVPVDLRVGETDVLPESVVRDGRDEYEVEYIVGYRCRRNKPMFNVKWRGYQIRTWEPVANLVNAWELVEDYCVAEGLPIPEKPVWEE